VQLFGQEIVKHGDARPADGRFLNELRDYREQADYRYEPIDADVDELFERAEAFVAEMDALV
jgi:uncharacterized protein (UPF0332 family)